MMTIRMNAWLQSSGGARHPENNVQRRPIRRPDVLRAGLTTGLLALALLAGVANPAETSARTTSLKCEALLGTIRVTQDMYSNLYDSGQYGTAENWGQLSLSLQRYYLSLGCNSLDADSAT